LAQRVRFFGRPPIRILRSAWRMRPAVEVVTITTLQ
jgi:hypothetical protein